MELLKVLKNENIEGERKQISRGDQRPFKCSAKP
jgi:hypothetical protein